jgi:hypothetical protein
MYYNPLRIIDEEFSQHAGLPRHLMPHRLSYRKKYFCKLVSKVKRNKNVVMLIYIFVPNYIC